MTGVVRHKDGRRRAAARNSSVAQICPGSTCGSTRAAQSTPSPPAIAASRRRPPARQHLAVVQRDPQPGLAGRRYTSSMRWRATCASTTGSSWTTEHRVAAADLGGDRLAGPFPDRLLQRLPDGASAPARISPPKPLTSPARTRAARGDGAVAASVSSPGPTVADDVDPVDALEICRDSAGRPRPTARDARGSASRAAARRRARACPRPAGGNAGPTRRAPSRGGDSRGARLDRARRTRAAPRARPLARCARGTAPRPRRG